MAKHRQHGGGPSHRQLRVGELIRRTLSDMLMRGEVHDPDLNRVSITVSEVRTSPDLRVATAYVLPLGGIDAEGALAALRRNRHELRKLVSRELELKFAPEIRFQIDDTFDRLDGTRALFARPEVQRDIARRDDDDDADDAPRDEEE